MSSGVSSTDGRAANTFANTRRPRWRSGIRQF